MSDWKEDLHPRGHGGKFGAGSWVGKTSDKVGKDIGEQKAGSLHLTLPKNTMSHPESASFYKRASPNTPLSGEERKHILSYAWGGSHFEKMNGALRGNPEANVPTEHVAGIHALTATINKSYLKQPTIVHRGLPDTPENRKLIAGKTMTDHGFMSTSTDEELAKLSADPIEEGKGIIMHIKLPTGTKAVSIGDQFDKEGGFNQHEVLVQRGSHLKITGRRQAGGYTHVDAMLIKQGK